MSNPESCWICGKNAVKNRDGLRDGHIINCSVCGTYKTTGTLEASNSETWLPPSERYRLSFVLRQRSLDKREPMLLDTNSIGDIVQVLPLPKPHTKANLLLLSFSKMFPTPGRPIKLDFGEDYPLACSIDGAELKYHFRALKERHFIDGTPNDLVITPSGWDRVDQLQNEPSVSKYAFVAFKFTTDALNSWKDYFGAAIEDAGFDQSLQATLRTTTALMRKSLLR